MANRIGTLKRIAGSLGVAVLLCSWCAAPANARRSIDFSVPGVSEVEDPSLGCLAGVTGTLTATAQSGLTLDGSAPVNSRAAIDGRVTLTPNKIHLGESVTLSWTTALPAGCAYFRPSFRLQRELTVESVPPSGTRVVAPTFDETIGLHAYYKGHELIVATVVVPVILPQTVRIHSPQLASQLVQALRSTDGVARTAIVSDGVEIDMTRFGNIPIGAGVQLLGERAGRKPGPRLYTTARLENGMFLITVDGVRISGLRLQGPDWGPVSDGVLSRGILAGSPATLEIDNNEFVGWSGVAIEVQDGAERISHLPPYGVRIHDNYFHHNQHQGGNGYGISARYGAYLLIERNVFDWNRHAIAADARVGTGYVADANLVFENGGAHYEVLGVTVRDTHQFDAHGSESCWGVGHSCGPAGHSFYIMRNTFLFTADNAVRLRGTPQLTPYGMFVYENVFAHDEESDAVSQTESGLWVGRNTYDNQVDEVAALCDFDGDAIADDFMTTGATWWYASGGTGPWRHLHTSTARLSDMTIGYLDADPRCDLSVGGTLYSAGRPTPPAPLTPPPTKSSIGSFGTTDLLSIR